MPQAWIPPRGELEKKVVFSPCRGDETTTYHDRAFVKSIPLRPRGIPAFSSHNLLVFKYSPAPTGKTPQAFASIPATCRFPCAHGKATFPRFRECSGGHLLCTCGEAEQARRVLPFRSRLPALTGKAAGRDSIRSNVLGGREEGVPGEGRGNLSSERFPLPSPDFSSATK